MSALAHVAATCALAPATHRAHLAKVRSVGKTPSCTPAVLATLCSSDPCLTFIILSRANLFAARPDDPITDLYTAIDRLKMPVALGVLFEVPVLPDAATPVCAACFRFAFACGVMAVCLARSIRHPPPALRDPDRVFTCGLLHDMGTVAGLLLAPEAFSRTRKRQERGEEGFDRILGEELGIAPTELGERFARQWQLPEAICECIRHRPDPAAAAGGPELPSVVATARMLVRGCGCGPPLSPWLEPFDEGILSHLDLGFGDLPAVVGDFLDEMRRLETYEGYR